MISVDGNLIGFLTSYSIGSNAGCLIGSRIKIGDLRGRPGVRGTVVDILFFGYSVASEGTIRLFVADLGGLLVTIGSTDAIKNSVSGWPEAGVARFVSDGSSASAGGSPTTSMASLGDSRQCDIAIVPTSIKGSRRSLGPFATGAGVTRDIG